MEIKININVIIVALLICILATSFVSLFLIPNYVDMKVDYLESLIESVNDTVNTPFTSADWAIEVVKDSFYNGGLDFNALAGNYIEANNLSSVVTWLYYTGYREHRWDVKVYFVPENNVMFAECRVYEFLNFTECRSTEAGMEIIKKYA